MAGLLNIPRLGFRDVNGLVSEVVSYGVSGNELSYAVLSDGRRIEGDDIGGLDFIQFTGYECDDGTPICTGDRLHGTYADVESVDADVFGTVIYDDEEKCFAIRNEVKTAKGYIVFNASYPLADCYGFRRHEE